MVVVVAVSSLSPILLSLSAQDGEKVSDQDYNCYNYPSAGLRTLWTQVQDTLTKELPPAGARPPLSISKLSLLPTSPPSPPTPQLQSPLSVFLPLSFPAALGNCSFSLDCPPALSAIISSPRISIHDAVHAHQGETPPSQNLWDIGNR